MIFFNKKVFSTAGAHNQTVRCDTALQNVSY